MVVRITGETSIFDPGEGLKIDKFLLADIFYQRQKELKNGMTQAQCLRIFGCSRSGYNSWVKREKDTDGKRAAKEAEERRIMELFRKVIQKHGYVPGKRTFHTELWREYGEHVSIKRCARLMKKMNLVANCPKKDAYKHQATHDHECASPANKVDQNFYIGPRKVILTDITYFYYGIHRTPVYMCAFRDAYTKQILGHSVGTRMTVDLVKEAYDLMMERFSSQMKNSEVFIHSDQGSQYLSTTFRTLLEDDGFIQSVSGRGNSQDNAPMESFFGRMKTQILDLVALCKDANTVKRMINEYICRYNSEFYQYALAGLTPDEFYTYVTTGIYPLDEYFGIKSTELMPVSDLVAERRRIADEKNRKAREAYAKRNAERNKLHKTPLQIIARDQKILRRQIGNWNQAKETAENQIRHLKTILEKTKAAVQFVVSLSQEALDELTIPQNWQKYPELDYIFDMQGLF